MPALIKASPAFLNGDIALIDYSFNDSSDLTVTIDAQFSALASARVDSLFRADSPMPAVLRNNASLSQMLADRRVQRDPVLTSCTITIANGIKTISARYASDIEESDDSIGAEISTSTELRSFSGSYTEGTFTRSYSFDYYATTSTVETTSANDNTFSGSSGVSAPFNVRGGLDRLRLRTQQIKTSRTYRNNLGQTRFSTTYSTVYVS